jgi:hypothetical protein
MLLAPHFAANRHRRARLQRKGKTRRWRRRGIGAGAAVHGSIALLRWRSRVNVLGAAINAATTSLLAGVAAPATSRIDAPA